MTMLNRLPRYTGSFAELLDNLGLTLKDAPRIAKALGVSARTIYRWWPDKAPRSALLSLWWLSREGHSTWDSEMANRTALAIGYADALRRELAQARGALAALGRIGDFGSANDPAPDAATNAYSLPAPQASSKPRLARMNSFAHSTDVEAVESRHAAEGR